MQMTMVEKRDFIERITSLTMHDVLSKEDRNEIYRLCMVACDREMAKLKEEK